MDLKERLRKLRALADAATAAAQAKWDELDIARKALGSAEIPDGKVLADTPEFVAAKTAKDAYEDVAAKARDAEQAHRDVLELMGTEAPERPSASIAGPQAEEHASIGQAFTESEVYLETAARIPDSPGSKVTIGRTDAVPVATREQARAILRGARATIFSTPPDVVAPDQVPGIRPLPLLPPLTVLDLITMATTDSTQVKWVREKVFTNAAAEVAESVQGTEATKPESALQLEAVNFDVTTVAHWIPAAKQALRDVAGVRSLIDAKLEWGLRRRLAHQVINGSGEDENLLGICNTEGIGHVDRSGSDAPSLIEDIYDGVVTVGDAYGEQPNVCFVDRAQYKLLRFARDNSGFEEGTGGYIFGPPNRSNPIEIENCLVLPNWDLPVGMGVMGVWREFAVWMHEGINIAMSDSHADYFVKNLVAILAEFSAAAGAMETVAFCEISAGSPS